MGWSDVSPHHRTSKVIAVELHNLLRSAGISPPFVLVGHSLGGLNVRMYAGLYRSEVAGMVPVDATPDDMKWFPPELQKYNDAFLRKENLKQETMPLGIPGLTGWCGNGPPALRSMVRTVDCRLQPWREHLAEYHAENESMAQVRASGSLGDIPLNVVSHDPGDAPDGFAKAQEESTHLSTRSSQVIAKGSGHNIQLDRPQVVITAIQSIVDENRHQRADVGAGR